MEAKTGFEPVFGASKTPVLPLNYFAVMEHLEGFEPPAPRLETSCSDQTEL